MTNIDKLAVIDPITWQGVPLPVRRWIVPGLVPHGSVTLLAGDGGVGKSLLAMQMLAAAALGRDWIGVTINNVRAIGVFCEDLPDELHIRMADIVRLYGCSFGDLENLNLLSRVGADSIMVDFPSQEAKGVPTAFYEQVSTLSREFGAQLLVLDSVHDVYGGNEIHRGQVRQFIGLLRRIAIDIDGAVVLLIHPSRAGRADGGGESGSTAWHAAARSRLYLTKPDDGAEGDDGRVLKVVKSNYGPSNFEIDLRWSDGVFECEGEPWGVVAQIKVRNDAKVFLRCLDIVAEQKRDVSDTVNSPRFAPRHFAQMPEGRRVGRKRLIVAMESLFASGEIKISEVPGSNRHPKKVIARNQLI